MAETKQFKLGKVFVFNTTVKRTGSEADVKLIESTFKCMHADVEICDQSKLKEKMNEVKNADFSAYDYVAVVWGSHGTEDDVAETGYKKYIYVRRALLTPLCKNRTLSGKLKWIITQVCRGEIAMDGPSILTEEFYDSKYYLISSSTTDGSKSWRFANGGSIFIKSLCKQILENQNLDIKSILKKVREEVQDEIRRLQNIMYEIYYIHHPFSIL